MSEARVGILGHPGPSGASFHVPATSLSGLPHRARETVPQTTGYRAAKLRLKRPRTKACGRTFAARQLLLSPRNAGPKTASKARHMLNGKQYIVVAVSGGSFPAELIADTLP
jgi:hypothetical protein